MSSEEEIIIIINQLEANNASILAALSGLTAKQKADALNDLNYALYGSTNAMESAGLA